MFVNVYLQDYLFDQTYRWSWIVGLSTILGTATVEKKEFGSTITTITKIIAAVWNELDLTAFEMVDWKMGIRFVRLLLVDAFK